MPAVAGLLLLAACNDDGRTLAPAPPVPVERATTTTAPTVSTPTAEVGLLLTSPAFTEGGLLDPAFTCDGVDVPPPLEISGIPAGAAELAIVVTDREDGAVHWVISGLSPTVTRIESGVVPPNAVTARTDDGVEGWQGPCPPAGDQPHAYEFVVYAAAEPIGLTRGLEGRRAIGVIEEAAIASDVLVAFYGGREG